MKIWTCLFVVLALVGCAGVEEGSERPAGEGTATITPEPEGDLQGTATEAPAPTTTPGPTAPPTEAAPTVDVAQTREAAATETAVAQPAEAVAEIPLSAVAGVTHRLGLIYGRSPTSVVNARNIYVIDVAGGRATALTAQPDAYERARWSPDGSRLAYMLNPEHGVYRLFVANGDGTDPVEISTFEHAPAYRWSPDGRYLGGVLSHGQGELHDLLLIDVAAGSQRTLAQNGDFIGGVAWSPDGTQILVTTAGLASQIFAVSVADGAMVQVTSDSSGKAGPAWSADGQNLAYHCTRNLCVQRGADGRRMQLYAVEDDQTLTWDPSVAIRTYPISVTGFAWSPDGASMAIIWDYATESSLCVFEFANPGNRQCMLTVDSHLEDLRWSPDGQHLAFSAPISQVYGDDAEGGMGLFIADVNSGEFSLLTYGDTINRFADVRWLE